ncbi:hypothetical protein [Polymorphospora rubra]|uniref:Uncharacterized protein n=1 Tax=Polymorphospora rubra TaxID=338584 RepID=A0A810NDN1_9ACTN|nr:hypothetical protein [Polymorphospora rubra]BCJ69603.1 hypothetical protein Prubr_66240 [Polymorphospora rubra]
MFEPTENELVNVVLFLLDVLLSYWFFWVPWVAIWLISEGRKYFSGRSSDRHDGASGDGGGFGATARKGRLELVRRDDGTGCWYVIDTESRDLVGEVIPSDVYPGKWRAAVRHPTSGYQFVCVASGRETLVGVTQVGTETFTTPQDAMRAIDRSRIY